MAKFLSGRQKNLNIGIVSYSEGTQVLGVLGRVGIGATIFNAEYDLDVRGNTNLFGNVVLGSSIDSIVSISGNTGIGSINPTSKLWVNGDGYFNGVVTATKFYGDGSQLAGISAGISISTNTENISQYLTYSVSTGSTTGLGVSVSGIVFNPYTGNLGIGTTDPISKIHVVGDIFVSGILTATDINSASDINLKTNIKPFENALDKVIQINGVTFDWKESKSTSAGIIAQDVEKVFPELVSDGIYKTVNYNGLIGVLVESIKELKQEVEFLKNKLLES